jgi:hypothetical protein
MNFHTLKQRIPARLYPRFLGINSDKAIYLQGEPVRIFGSISNTSNALVKSSPVTLDVIDQNKKNVIYSASIPQNRTFNYSFNNIWATKQGKISNEPFESGIKEPQKQIPVVEDQQVNVLPENEEEEKEEIPLTTARVASALKVKTSPGKRQLKGITSPDIGKHLKRQTEQLNKVTIMVQSIQKGF